MIVDELRRARAARRLRQAVRVHARARLLHPHGLLDRAAPLAAGEDLHRLREVPAVPAAAASTRWSCRSTSAFDAERGYGAAGVAPRAASRSMTAHTLEPSTAASTTPRGFRAAGVSAGIKASGGLDLALLVVRHAGARRPPSSRPTWRRRRRSSSRASTSRARGGMARAIVVNSGCANACTGDDGLRGRARHGGGDGARCVGCPAEQVLVASTGVIGVGAADGQDPRRAAGGVRGARRRSGRAGRARDHDDRSVSEGSGGARRASAARDVTIGGMAKGSGMIEPMMATMLGFVTTDAAVPPALLRPRAARSGGRHVQRDHRRRRVLDQRLRDAARQRRQRRRRSTRRPTARSSQALTRRLPRARARHRARRRRRDQAGHGHGHRRGVDATRRARRRKAIANSPLVKTAIHGGDPNWGRLIAVAGRAGVAFELDRARGARSASIVLFEDGRPYDEAAPEAAEYLQGRRHRRCRVDLGAGGAVVHGLDLRSERRVRAHQRGLPNMSMTAP